MDIRSLKEFKVEVRGELQAIAVSVRDWLNPSLHVVTKIILLWVGMQNPLPRSSIFPYMKCHLDAFSRFDGHY
jgi:hypothetical protein